MTPTQTLQMELQSYSDKSKGLFKRQSELNEQVLDLESQINEVNRRLALYKQAIEVLSDKKG